MMSWEGSASAGASARGENDNWNVGTLDSQGTRSTATCRTAVSNTWNVFESHLERDRKQGQGGKG